MRKSIQYIVAILSGILLTGFFMYIALAKPLVSSSLYLPLVMRPQDTPTPTATLAFTATPTHTQIPTSSPTPTATPTQQPGPAIIKITHIEYDPPGTDLDGEYVTIHNQGQSSANITGWVLSDNDLHDYTFPTFTLQPGTSVNIWSKSGSNTSTNLYWGSDQAIWTNTGDCATLKNGSSTIDQRCY
jgi:hypothetical protein